MVDLPLLVLRPAVLFFAAYMSLVNGPSASLAAEPSYILGTGDKVRITVFDEPELSGDFEIDASGSLSLQLIGKVKATGLNTRDLRHRIVERLRNGYLLRPQVTVDVLAYRPFYIIGDVKKPGSYPYVSGMTVVNAIALAGGYFLTEDDDVRFRLEVTRARESLELLQGDYWAALAHQARLLAERDGAEKIRFPLALAELRGRPKIAEMMEGQERIFTARRKILSGDVEIFKLQISQYRHEISAREAQLKADMRKLELLRSEIQDIEGLYAQGFARKTQLTVLQRTAAQLEGDRYENLALIARAKKTISEVKMQIVNGQNAYLKQVIEGYHEIQKQVSDLEKRLRAASEILRQTEAKFGIARAGLAAREDLDIIITRETGDGAQDMTATENTLVLPGDIVRIPGFQNLPFDIPAALVERPLQ